MHKTRLSISREKSLSSKSLDVTSLNHKIDNRDETIFILKFLFYRLKIDKNKRDINLTQRIYELSMKKRIFSRKTCYVQEHTCRNQRVAKENT